MIPWCIDDAIVLTGNYPTKAEWMKFLANETSEEESPKTHVDDVAKTNILISIGASMAASNEKALKQFISEAKATEISVEEIANAMNIGNDCRVKLSHEVIQTANTLLNEMQPAAASSCSPGTGCC